MNWTSSETVAAITAFFTALATTVLAVVAVRTFAWARLQFRLENQPNIALDQWHGRILQKDGKKNVVVSVNLISTDLPVILHWIRYNLIVFVTPDADDKWVLGKQWRYLLEERNAEFHRGRIERKTIKPWGIAQDMNDGDAIAILEVEYEVSIVGMSSSRQHWHVDYWMELEGTKKVSVTSIGTPYPVENRKKVGFWARLKAWPCKIRIELGGGCPD